MNKVSSSQVEMQSGVAAHSLNSASFGLKSRPSRRTIPAFIEAQAARRPNAIAVCSSDKQLTYSELNERSNQLAHKLGELGVTTESVVGIYMERTLDAIVSIVAVLKAGGAYLPIDLAYPSDRVEFMLGDSKAQVLLTQEHLRARLSGLHVPNVALDSLDWASCPKTAPKVKTEAENAAYIIYTSGSTGRPKGVVVTHENVLRLFESTAPWYGFNQEDVWTLFHSLAFDFSVWEIWGALLYGGRLVVVPYLTSRSPEAFYGLLASEGVTVLNQTPSAFRQLIWAEQSAPRELKLRYVIFGGEALELQSLRPWFDRHGDASPLLVNMYGITETTVHVTYRPIRLADLQANRGSVIGVPIPDLQIYILDEEQRECAVDVAGEIYVGGAGVARGYLNRPELNAEKFIPDPFEKGGRLYRSGDLAKRLADGDLEYLGRIDHQVKIRGFRIELGEIETALNSHPAVRESVMTVQEQGEHKRLVGYLVTRGDQPSLENLREFLAAKLPQYMIPAVFVFLEKLPLTINGKVDRRALPAPEMDRAHLAKEYVAPDTREEQILAEIWQEVLGLDRVGVNDNFFELGGDSIRSIQVLAKAQQRGLFLSLEKLFEKPTIRQVIATRDSRAADVIEQNKKPFALVSEADRALIPDTVEDAYPMAKLQVGMVFHSDFDPLSAVFHDVFSFQLSIPYQEEILKEALARLVQRHSIYRTGLELGKFSEPLQLVYRKVVVPFSMEDLRGQSGEEQFSRLVAWVEKEKRNRFDWSQAPLMRIHVQRYSEGTFQFIVSFHHVIMDGWSLAAMLTELFQDYDGLLQKRPQAIEAPRVTYRDFVRLEGEALRSSDVQQYWKKKLENPTVHRVPRWPGVPRRGGREQVRGPEILIGDDVFKGLRQLAQAAGVPIRTVLLAAHCKVMGTVSGHTDMITGLVANGRPQTLDGERLIGLFLNTLPLRLQLAKGESWKALVQKTFQAERELIPHRRAPLSQIQQWAGGKQLFETTFDFVQFHVYRDLPGYGSQGFLEGHYFEANNFNLYTTFMVDASSTQLQMHFDYNPNEFCEEQIRWMCDYYVNTLREMAAKPEEAYATFSPLPPEEKTRLLEEWNATARPIPDLTLADLLEAQAAKTPETVAVVCGDTRLTYSALNKRANFIAAKLQRMGVRPDVLVGVHCERSIEMLVAAMAVLKAGGGYVPLDPSYPAARLEFVANDAGLKAILTQSKLRDRLPAKTAHVFCVDEMLAEFVSSETTAVTRTISGDHVAYTIYTSGSTGKPKGVRIPHRSVVNFLEAMKVRPGIVPSDKLLAVTTLSFDISVLELFLPLVTGATVILATNEMVVDPAQLIEAIRQQGITMMQATPTTWRALLDAGWEGRKTMKVLSGGEALPPELAGRLFQATGALWNMYGPTETTVWSSAGRIEDPAKPITIGRPISNTEIYILDDNLQPAPLGADGEIYIGGSGLALDYLNRPELTRERFIEHPFGKKGRLYRTGDVGRFLPDGNLICTGRTDFQVKIRGHRIELGEIEAALAQHPAVKSAVVTAREGAGEPRLVGYWIAREEAAASPEFRKFLEQKLPGYMVPSVFVQVSKYPLTPNGKVDRKQLPDPGQTGSELERSVVPPRTPLEAVLGEAWIEILKLDQVGIQDNFFDLGGHSLLAAQIISRLRLQLDTELTIASFFEHPTIEQFAFYLMQQMVSENDLSDPDLDRLAATTPLVPRPTEVLEYDKQKF